jgi:hypothetical protein
MSRHRSWDDVALGFLFVAAFPRLAYWLRWPTRLGPRGFVAYAAFNTLSGFAIGTWLVPYLRRTHEENERALQELRDRLGREPTEDEAVAHLVAARTAR